MTAGDPRSNPGAAPPLARFAARLSLPLIAAPMFLVSGVELVVAACQAGVVGAFPSANCRDPQELDHWLARIGEALRDFEQSRQRAAAPFAVNLIVHRSNPRLAQDLAVAVRHGTELVITSVGSPEAVVGPLHDAGCLVLADVASLRHAEKAIAAGVDGLVLLTAGAGGQTGWANPFAFVRAVRAFWDGPLVLAGGVGDGQALAAARVLGCDLAYMGTRFIASTESLAPPAYKTMLVESGMDDVVLTRAFTGLETNMLRPSIVAAGLDPDQLPARGAIDVSKDIDAGARALPGARRWKDVWSAGHAVSSVHGVTAVADIVRRTRHEFESALRAAGSLRD